MNRAFWIYVRLIVSQHPNMTHSNVFNHIEKRKDAMVAKAFEKSSKESQRTKKEARLEDIKEILGMK